MQAIDFVVQGLEETIHEHRYFFARPLPVLAREREQRQHLDIPLGAVLDDLLDRAHTHAMTGRTWQSASRGPTTVAIHDHRDVTRHAARTRVLHVRLVLHHLFFFFRLHLLDLGIVLLGQLLLFLLRVPLLV